MKIISILLAVTLLLTTLLLTGCKDQEQLANRGFSLPEGDADSGQIIFIELGCIQCHTLAGTDLADEEWRLDGERDISVELGGKTTKLQSYGDLVTSIINPSHRIAKGYPLEEVVDEMLNGRESKMYNYNDIMRVSDLVDLVTFLKSKYELKPIPLTVYPYYLYPS